MRVLYLTLQGHWYEMVDAGDKLEEYREIKPYWIKRLLIDVETVNPTADMDYLIANINTPNVSYCFQDYTHVHFARGGHFGASIPQMRFEIGEFDVRKGRTEWGAEPRKDYFVIYLGKRALVPTITK